MDDSVQPTSRAARITEKCSESVVKPSMHFFSVFLTASRLLWAAPCSLLGLLLGAVALLAGGKVRWVNGALECCLECGAFSNWLQRYQPFAAITLGHVIVALNDEVLRRWHAHERVHVKQFERWGVLMLLAYPAASLWAWLKGQDPYLANHFERQAYEAQLLDEI